ncbi:unnamed protein product [Enterobius vermicularis]|uniref:Suppressor protein SRP40-like n=1 Tax=Enterobius vermicularis TaxID=51028 RepID=A0A0N4VJK0_ENTVE|nr:unnamed protein product [Enterobius vermicularis]
MSDSEIFRPRTTLKLHRLSKRKWGKSDDEAMLSSDSDEEDENCFDMDNDILSDSDSCDPMPVARGPQKHWYSKGCSQRCKYRSHSSRRMKSNLQFGSLSTICPVNHSSSFELSNDCNDDTDDLYLVELSSVHFDSVLFCFVLFYELSPITASNGEDNGKDEKAPKSRLLWRPLQTSTTTSMPYCLPKTNPHHVKCSQAPSSTPRLGPLGPLRSLNTGTGHGDKRPSSYHEQLSPKLWGTTSSTASTTTAAVRPRSEYPLFNYGTSWKPEHIGLPGAMARKLGCKGKLNLTISLYRRYMTVNIIKAYYCLDPYQPPASSFIKGRTSVLWLCSKKEKGDF